MPEISQPSAGCSGFTANGQSRACCLRWAWAIWAIESSGLSLFRKAYRFGGANKSRKPELSRMAELSSRQLPLSFEVGHSVLGAGRNETFRARCVYALLRGRVRPRRMGPALAACGCDRVAARDLCRRFHDLLP